MDRDERGIAREMNRRAFLKMVGVTAALAACEGAAPPPATAAPTSAATAGPTAAATVGKPAGQISVYSALNESTSDRLLAAFRAATPSVEVDLLSLAAAGELQTRIRVEKVSPKADVFLGGDSSVHGGLAKEGLLERYTSPNAKDIAAGSKDANGSWTGWDLAILGIGWNADRVTKDAGGTRATTWDDLLDPKWKDKLILPDPIKTDAGFIFIATLVFRFEKDESKAMDYMKKLHANVAQYPGTSLQAIELISRGQFVASPSWAHDILTEKAKNPGIELTVPEETGYEINAISIIKGTKDLPAAKVFVDWVLSKEAGELNVKLSNRVSVRTDVPPPAGAPTLQTVKLVSYDREWASQNKDRLLKLWQQTVGRA